MFPCLELDYLVSFLNYRSKLLLEADQRCSWYMARIIAGKWIFGATFCNITRCTFALEFPFRFLNSYCFLHVFLYLVVYLLRWFEVRLIYEISIWYDIINMVV